MKDVPQRLTHGNALVRDAVNEEIGDGPYKRGYHIIEDLQLDFSYFRHKCDI